MGFVVSQSDFSCPPLSACVVRFVAPVPFWDTNVQEPTTAECAQSHILILLAACFLFFNVCPSLIVYSCDAECSCGREPNIEHFPWCVTWPTLTCNHNRPVLFIPLYSRRAKQQMCQQLSARLLAHPPLLCRHRVRRSFGFFSLDFFSCFIIIIIFRLTLNGRYRTWGDVINFRPFHAFVSFAECEPRG